MQRQTPLEISVGAFVALGGAALFYLSITLGGLHFGRTSRYPITARFSNVGSLKVGDPVKVAGVLIGQVGALKLVDFAAEAELQVDASIKLPDDTIASVQSAGLLGDAYVSLSPGASDKDLAPAGRIERTEPAVSLTELLGKYAFGNPTADGPTKGEAQKPNAEDKPSPFSDPLK